MQINIKDKNVLILACDFKSMESLYVDDMTARFAKELDRFGGEFGLDCGVSDCLCSRHNDDYVAWAGSNDLAKLIYVKNSGEKGDVFVEYNSGETELISGLGANELFVLWMQYEQTLAKNEADD